MITLHRLGNRAFMRPTAAEFGVGTTTVHEVFWRTVCAIYDHLLTRYIRWPTGQELQNVQAGFAEHGLGEGIVGAIDCTHVSVHPPGATATAYLDRSFTHSIVTQAVVDYRGAFTDIAVGLPGSAHDMKVFKQSSLHRRIELGALVTGDQFLVADSGYYCRSFIIPPYNQRRGQEPTPDELGFNKAHAQTRGIVERTFGQLKGRFRILRDAVEGPIANVQKIVAVCMVLHNFGLLHGEPPLGDDEAAPDPVHDDNAAGDSHAHRPSDRNALELGRARRERIFREWLGRFPAGRAARPAAGKN